MQRFRDLKLIYKLVSIGLGTIVFFAIGIFGFILPQFQKTLVTQKQISTQHIVEAAISLVSHYAVQVEKGDISLQDGREMAKESIRQLRFGSDNYIWVNDLEGTMIVHPAKPELEGKNILGVKDPNGVYLFKEAIHLSKNQGFGMIEYTWAKPGHDKPVPKISYVKLLPDWDWVIGTGEYLDDIDKEVSTFLLALLVIFSVCATIAIIAAGLIARTIAKPVARGVEFAELIAQGDLTKTMDARQNDEIGALAASLNGMVGNLNQMFVEVREGVGTLELSSSGLAAVSEQMKKNGEYTSNNAETVMVATDKMSSKMNDIAAASEQASANVAMVASAAEEMSATVSEIARNSENASIRTTSAVDQAISASEKVDLLGKAANEISKVTEVINDISEQTNLLALNATIEAARAGEAGKGFGVVANEIKELARQTADATREIKEKITGIQGSTSETIAEIDQITQTINEVNEVVATIASSVEEQSAATKEIAENVLQASQGISEVNANVVESSKASSDIFRQIQGVDQSSTEMAESSNTVNASAKDLLELSSRLSQAIAQFSITKGYPVGQQLRLPN